ncbi:MAG: beta strand repeat-containing protein, partial [Planctomycetota bacterium]
MDFKPWYATATTTSSTENVSIDHPGSSIIAISDTIQGGIDAAVDGGDDVVEVSTAGTYNENITVKTDSATNATLTADSGVVVNLMGGADNFILGGAEDEGFTINSQVAGTTFLVQLENAPQNVEISWNTIDTTDNASMGISVGAAGATGLNINNNIFTAGDLGDGSIWGPYMVDVSVTDNTFTGPAAKAASGYAVEFAGVTGISVIQNNTISNYGMGIAIFNGTGTSGLSIQENSVTDCKTGIRLGQYSPGALGNMTTVAVTGNTLTDNTTGLQINNGTNVLASNFTIANNFFNSNATGIESQHNSQSATIFENSFSGNWWDGSDVGTVTAAISGSVDYTPWLDSGVDQSGDPGFQGDFSHLHVDAASPQTVSTGGRIDEAIGLLVDDVSSKITAEAGIYPATVNVNKQFEGLYFRGTSEIGDTVTLNADLDIYTQNNGALTLNAVEDADTHSLLVDTESLNATNGQIDLDGSVEADGGITITGGIVNVGDGVGVDKVDSDGIVSITGTGTVTINAEIDPATVTITSEADASVNINNAVTADSQITITADDDVIFSVDGDLSLTTSPVSITVTADADSDENGSGGMISMTNGTEINASTGTITLAADENITLGRLVTTNDTASAVAITTTSGAVTDAGNIGGVDIEAADASAGVTIAASTGIGAADSIETSATDITASTDAGNIDIDNYIDSATTASLAVTTGAGDIWFSQDDGGSLDVTSATTSGGSIYIDVDDATLTAQIVTAGGSG